MIPEPITATIRKPVPSASATSRRVRSRSQRSGAGLDLDVELGVVWDAHDWPRLDETVDTLAQLADGGVERCR